MITLELVKEWLKVDQDDYDELTDQLLQSASSICADVLRLDRVDDLEPTPRNRIAILFTMAYLFEHREDADLDGLKKNLRALLEPERKAAF
ncbi:head-tail connector protein [Allobaculum mucilyticum]|uniref:head-tail connector protein n=1 Tax=Allobaculum mucilyticum TaxID=2834459 RepID=UPI001E29783B|nr:head-tail connector protein [Allobaculum mucilyticum]UNT96677.1 head-tail connector protein [Allobaculum mucilyticum]